MARKDRLKVFPAVLVFIFNKKGQILLHKRSGTNYMNGYYDVPSGHAEEDETFSFAAARELKEETGLIVKPKDLKFIEVFQVRKEKMELHDYVHFFFMATRWKGIPKIMEPDKASEMRWFSVRKLPLNIIPYLKVALSNLKRDISYQEYGWS